MPVESPSSSPKVVPIAPLKGRNMCLQVVKARGQKDHMPHDAYLIKSLLLFMKEESSWPNQAPPLNAFI